MRLSLGMMFQNYADWDRFLALERGEEGVGEASVPDWRAWKDHLDIFLQADELGFDALWSVEHHFTPYCLIPDPLQLLTYIAGATKRIRLRYRPLLSLFEYTPSLFVSGCRPVR